MANRQSEMMSAITSMLSKTETVMFCMLEDQMKKKLKITITLERAERGDYPLSDANQVLLSVAEQFEETTKRYDTRLTLPVRLKLNDHELGFSGTVVVDMVKASPTETPKALRPLSPQELARLATARAKKRSQRD